MAQGRISKRSVDSLACPPGKDREFLWDDALAGFGVGAFPTGKKTYYIQFRKGGRTRRSIVGDHGRMTPDEARSAAKKLLGGVEQGADPVATRRAEKAVRAFREVAAAFMAGHVESKRKRLTFSAYETLLRKHILPAIGAMRVTDIRRSHIARMHAGMSDSPGAANRAVSLVSAIWNWSARRDEVSFHDNPAKGIERNREQRKERFLGAAELARLGDALREAETNGFSYEVDETKPKAKHAPKPENRRTVADPFAVAAIRLLILTGARLREILHAKWEQVDLERGVIFLADSKTGQKPIYLSAAALAVLSGIPRIEGNPHLIAGARDGRPRADLKRPWAATLKAAGLGGVRIHDMRHSFASIGAGASLGLPIIGKLLGHTQASTTARYAHLDADPMRRAANAIGATIAAAMERKPRENVIEMTKTAK